MAQEIRKVHNKHSKKEKLVSREDENWKHDIDQHFITATPSQFKIRFTKEWVEKCTAIPVENLSDPVSEGSVEDLHSQQSELDSIDLVPRKTNRPDSLETSTKRKGENSKVKNSSARKNKKQRSTSRGDSKYPDPDPPKARLSHSPIKQSKQPRARDERKTLTATHSQHNLPQDVVTDRRRSSHLHHVQAHSKRTHESLGQVSGLRTNKVTPAPTESRDRIAEPRSSSSDLFSVKGPEIPCDVATDAGNNNHTCKFQKKKVEQVGETSCLEAEVEKVPHVRTSTRKAHLDEQLSIKTDYLQAHSKVKGATERPEETSNSYPNKKTPRPSRLAKIRAHKIRRRKVGIVPSERAATIPEKSPSPLSRPILLKKLERIRTAPESPRLPNNDPDETSEERSEEVQLQSVGAGSVEVETEKDSDSSSSLSGIVPARYLRPKAPTEVVREIYFHDTSRDSGSDSVRESAGLKTPTTNKLKGKSNDNIQGDDPKLQSGRQSARIVSNVDDITHAEGNARYQERSDPSPADPAQHHGDKAVKSHHHDYDRVVDSGKFSTVQMSQPGTPPELAMFVQRAKPSLSRNPRLKWNSKPSPLVLYFDSKIMPRRGELTPKFVPLLPREEKLKRLYEENAYEEEILDVLTQDMTGRSAAIESELASLARSKASQASLRSRSEEYTQSHAVKSDWESLLHPIPPSNTPGPSLPVVPSRK